MNNKGATSLNENYFLIKHPVIAKELLKNNFYKEDKINNKNIITTCQLALNGIKYGISQKKCDTIVYSLSEYINLLTKND